MGWKAKLKKKKRKKGWHEFMAYVYVGFILTSRLIPAGTNPRNYSGWQVCPEMDCTNSVKCLFPHLLGRAPNMITAE